MTIENIFVTLDSNEQFEINEPIRIYNLEDNDCFTYTLWNNKFEVLSHFFSKQGLDLFYISLAVYGADRTHARASTQDNWTRKFKLYMPVLEIEHWESNKELLAKMLQFLSGDEWHFEFRTREYTAIELKVKNMIEKRKYNKNNIKKICMFSGGLDSFIGATDLLTDSKKVDEVLFVSHYPGGKGVKEYQEVLGNSLKLEYLLKENQFFSFYAVAKFGSEETTRTRSFMFFSHALLLATAVEGEIDLIIPENGLISLNIPLTNSRLGSSSTRTTHPYYMELLQQLISNLNIKVNLKNPYQFKTKGEMIIECLNSEFLISNLGNTMSCSHPDNGRMNGDKITSHCGNCLPCVIRRASIIKAELEDQSLYRDLDFTNGPTSRINFMSYNIGIEKFNPDYSFLNIQNSGPINKDLESYIKVFNKGMQELAEFLEVYNVKVLS